MIININVNIKTQDCKVLLFNKDNKYSKFIKLNQGLNPIDFNLNETKYIYFKIGKKRTDTLILADNIKALDLVYNPRTKSYTALFNGELKDYGKVKNVMFIDEQNLSYKKKPEKKVTYYFSPDFKNKDVHLIVFFDSQNIYDKNHVGSYTTKQDPYGGWQIDVPIALSGKNFIVAGIENADTYRGEELSLSVDEDDIRQEFIEPTGKLDCLQKFITNKVLPYLKKYKIVDTAIAGASMGGLAAHYLGVKHPHIYQYVFSLSSASGFYKDSYWRHFYYGLNLMTDQKFFYYQGEGDELEKTLANGNKNLVKTLTQAGYDKSKVLKYHDKTLPHNEISWRYAFNYAFNEFYNK